jgi:membrane-bound lytic murein transglycosylase D
MRLNDVVDDRRDPLFSTEAAAAHLRDDYVALQSWPLAITAYNHGRYGVVRAIKRLGTRNIADIVRRYRSPSFGFASRNFYASFLAAVDVYRDYPKYFGPLERELPMRYEYVRIHDYVPFATLGRLSGLHIETFKTWNPAYNPEVIDGKLWVPPLHRIRVPVGSARVFALRYAGLTVAERSSSQRPYYVARKAPPKKTLVAQASKGKPAPGSAPAKSVPSERKQIAQADKPASPAKASRRPLRHKVIAGQTVGHIAQRYNTSVRAILHANKISDPKRIRVGQVLVIPRS